MPLPSLLDQGVVVLTASRRLAHGLRLAYARHAQARGLAVWRTPQVLTWSAWLRQQFLALRAAGEIHFQRVLSPAQSRVLWDQVINDSRAGRELLAPSNAARLAARSWQRMHDYLIPLEQLARFDSPECNAFRQWSGEFQQRCATLGAIDEARLSHALYASQFVPPERLAFAGFDVLSPAMRRLVDRWRTVDRIVDAIEPATATAQVDVIAAADATAELELAAQWARSQVESGATSVGVILGDLQARAEEVRRTFEDVFAPGQRHTQAEPLAVPVVVAAPPPLASYALVDAALLVIRLATGESDSLTVGKLLRSPFIEGGVSERNERALADQKLREEQRDVWDWPSLERWAAVCKCDRLSLAARSLTVMLRNAPRRARPSEWAERYQSMLLHIAWPGERSLSSSEQQTLAKFYETLAEFGALDAVVTQLTANQALQRFHELLRDTPFEPETPAGSVLVIDAATSAGMQFDALWVGGLQADKFPASMNPDPLIPLELQRTSGVPEATAGALLQLAQNQLERWQRSTRRLILSWPEREGDAELTMSPLLADFASGALPELRVRSLRSLLFEVRPELDFIEDDRAPPFVGATASGGAAIIELQSRCPFKAHAQLRWNAKPLERVALGVDPAERGGILHTVLHEVWANLQSQDALLRLSDADLEERVRSVAQRAAMKILAPDSLVRERLTSLEVESAVRQAMQVLAIERTRPPFKVRFAEAAEKFSIGGLNVTLRPDRIDELIDGGELLIDYKLGDVHRPTHWLDRVPGRPKSPQLPLYGLAHGDRLRALAFVVLAAGKVEYRGWSDGASVGPGVDAYPPKRLRIDLGDPMDWPALLAQWRFTLTRLAERFVAGEATVDPLPGECDYCHLSTLCRIHERGGSNQLEVEDE